ncbi:hypothetical protein IKQ26_02315 [bacterium]|nr:hypothetical protein [bacterium]
MSCTVVAMPIALGWWLVGGIIATTTVAATTSQSTKKDYLDYKYISEGCTNEEETIPMEETLFKTVFADKNTLVKTLSEHGGNIQTETDLKIKCVIDNFELTFEREKKEEAFELKIRHNPSETPATEIENLDSEYKLNVQEQAYLQLVDKIKEKNMEIEEEEVLEDNTIVLTINLD